MATTTLAPRRTAAHLVWGAPLIVLLAAFVPVLVALQRGTGQQDTAFALQLVLVAYAGARLGWVVVSGRPTILRGAFWLFVYTAMGVASLAQLVLGQFPTPVAGNRAHLVNAIVVVLLGCAAFDVGCWVGDRRRAATLETGGLDVSGAAQVAGSGDGADVRVAAHPRLFLLAGFALLASAFLVLRLGGVAMFFDSRQAISASIGESGLASADSQVGSALIRGFGTVPVLVMLLVFTRWLLISREARRSPLVLGTTVALVLANAVVNNPVSNPRYWALTVLLSWVFVVVRSSARAFRAVLVGGVVGALVLFPYADRFRYDEAGTRQLESGSVMETLALKDFDQLAMTANAVAFTRVGEGHTDGAQLLGSALFFVPRQIWPDKAADTGLVLGEWLGTTNTNLSAPLWAELWIDLGHAGVVLGFLGLGLLAARWDRRYEEGLAAGLGPHSALMVVVPVVAGYSFILLRGSLLQATGRIAILAIMATLLVVGRRGDAGRGATVPRP